MKSLMLSGLSDELHRNLAERAAANKHSLEEEAVHRLQQSLDEDAVLAAIPLQRWEQIERSLAESVNEPASDLTAADLKRYRNLARSPDAR